MDFEKEARILLETVLYHHSKELTIDELIPYVVTTIKSSYKAGLMRGAEIAENWNRIILMTKEDVATMDEWQPVRDQVKKEIAEAIKKEANNAT